MTQQEDQAAPDVSAATAALLQRIGARPGRTALDDSTL